MLEKGPFGLWTLVLRCMMVFQGKKKKVRFCSEEEKSLKIDGMVWALS